MHIVSQGLFPSVCVQSYAQSDTVNSVLYTINQSRHTVRGARASSASMARRLCSGKPRTVDRNWCKRLQIAKMDGKYRYDNDPVKYSLLDGALWVSQSVLLTCNRVLFIYQLYCLKWGALQFTDSVHVKTLFFEEKQCYLAKNKLYCLLAYDIQRAKPEISKK